MDKTIMSNGACHHGGIRSYTFVYNVKQKDMVVGMDAILADAQRRFVTLRAMLNQKHGHPTLVRFLSQPETETVAPKRVTLLPKRVRLTKLEVFSTSTEVRRVLMELILNLPTVQFHLILLDVLTTAFSNLMRGIRRMLCDHPLQHCSCSSHRHHRLRAVASGGVRLRRIPQCAQ